MKCVLTCPICCYAFMDDAWAVFLYGELWKTLSYHLCYSWTFLFAEKLITKLDNIIAECILYNFVNTKSNLIDEFFLRLCSKLFYLLWWVIFLQLCNQFHHMLNYTHSIFIKRKVDKILLSVLKKLVSMYDRKETNNFLYKMRSVRMARKLEKVFLDAFAHEFILFIIGKELDQGLNSMGTLFIPDNISNFFMQALHNFEPLCIATYIKQLLHHIIRILMRNQLGQLHIQSLNNYINLFTSGLWQESLKLSTLGVMSNK